MKQHKNKKMFQTIPLFFLIVSLMTCLGLAVPVFGDAEYEDSYGSYISSIGVSEWNPTLQTWQNTYTGYHEGEGTPLYVANATVNATENRNLIVNLEARISLDFTESYTYVSQHIWGSIQITGDITYASPMSLITPYYHSNGFWVLSYFVEVDGFTNVQQSASLNYTLWYNDGAIWDILDSWVIIAETEQPPALPQWQEGFEDWNVLGWTNSTTSGIGSYINIDDTSPFEGDYCLNASTPKDTVSHAYAKYDFADFECYTNSAVYVNFQFKLLDYDIPPYGNTVIILRIIMAEIDGYYNQFGGLTLEHDYTSDKIVFGLELNDGMSYHEDKTLKECLINVWYNLTLTINHTQGTVSLFMNKTMSNSTLTSPFLGDGVFEYITVGVTSWGTGVEGGAHVLIDNIGFNKIYSLTKTDLTNFFIGIAGIILMVASPSWFAVKLREGLKSGDEIIERGIYAFILFIVGYCMLIIWLGAYL